MTSYLPIKQPIFFRNAAADVVDDQVSFGPLIPVVRDETDMGHSFAVEVPRDDVARLIITAVGRDRDGFALAGKKRLQIGNPSMIDVCVRMVKSPFLRIHREVRRHIFVDLFLQVDAGLSKSSDHNVSARSCIGRHIAAGIRDHSVVLCVMRRYLKLFASTLDDVSNRLRWNITGSRSFECRARCYRAKLMFKRRSAAAGQTDEQGKQANYQSGSHKMPLAGDGSQMPPQVLER
jgi:hypothetical protein